MSRPHESSTFMRKRVISTSLLWRFAVVAVALVTMWNVVDQIPTVQGQRAIVNLGKRLLGHHRSTTSPIPQKQPPLGSNNYVQIQGENKWWWSFSSFHQSDESETTIVWLVTLVALVFGGGYIVQTTRNRRRRGDYQYVDLHSTKEGECVSVCVVRRRPVGCRRGVWLYDGWCVNNCDLHACIGRATCANENFEAHTVVGVCICAEREREQSCVSKLADYLRALVRFHLVPDNPCLYLPLCLCTDDFVVENDRIVARNGLKQVDLAFEGIQLVLTKKGTRRDILDGSIRGRARPGRMLAIMGPSGAGKSTVLHAIAGRIKDSSALALHGTRYWNGVPLSEDSLIPAAFIEQDVSFFQYMTVRETLAFRVELKLGSLLSKAGRDAMVQDLLNEMGLARSADTIVGDTKVRGISGGERKRLSIAVEMISTCVRVIILLAAGGASIQMG
jgi:ABC-type lipoprotein export system ATPase subunit